MVGHLQTNKVKRALECFDLIESVDSLHLAEEISRRATACGRRVEVFVEVNTSGEPSKFGVPPEQAPDLVRRIARLPGVQVTGLMTVGAFLPDPELVRPCFVTLRQLKEEIDRLGIEGVGLKHLSMGMTDDFEVAVEEGATLVRIGRALFGPRPNGMQGNAPGG
jgi:pyridoxal phosphate enzyme (YggS family)